ncbi:hypothetical protein D3C79_914500 [compost metagenome]
MHLNAEGYTHSRRQAGLAALCITAAGDHGEIRARADDGQKGEKGDSEKLSHERSPR